MAPIDAPETTSASSTQLSTWPASITPYSELLTGSPRAAGRCQFGRCGRVAAKRLSLLDDNICILIHDMLEEEPLELPWSEIFGESQLDTVFRIGLEM